MTHMEFVGRVRSEVHASLRDLVGEGRACMYTHGECVVPASGPPPAAPADTDHPSPPPLTFPLSRVGYMACHGPYSGPGLSSRTH